MGRLFHRAWRGWATRAAVGAILCGGALGGWLFGSRSAAGPARPPTPARSESFGMSAEQAARARNLVVRENCLVCHRIGEVGGTAGPDLTDYAAREIRAEDLVVFLREPRSWYPSATMPAYRKLSRADAALIANYVCGLLGSQSRNLPPGAALDRNVCGPRFLPTGQAQPSGN